MRCVNEITLMGYIASEITDREFDNGTKCSQFILKTRDFYGPAGDKKVDKNFHSIIMWNGISEMASSVLKKEDIVYVKGKLKNHRIEGKEKGDKPIYKTEVVCTEWTKICASTPSTEIESDED